MTFSDGKSLNTLDELLTLSPSERSRRLDRSDTLQAFAALGKDAAVEWLENHIEPPIGPAWGRTLHYLKINWEQLNRWVQRSKLHCLAAIDAIAIFAAATDVELANEAEPQLPEGATPDSIQGAVDFALANFRNPRLEKAAQRILPVWSRNPRKRHQVSVPPALTNVASILFREDVELMRQWTESLATAREPPDGPFEIYDALLNFAEERKILAIVDWRAPAEEVVASLRALTSARQLGLRWQDLLIRPGDNEHLFRAIHKAVSREGNSFVCLDHGCDDYPLTFLQAQDVGKVRELIASCADPECMRLLTFE
jgi:hypothetical protein